jgi:neutral ceramidase
MRRILTGRWYVCSPTALLAAALAAAVASVGFATGGADAPSPSQTPGTWRAGVARITVTPREPIFLKGYGSRNRPSEGVRQDLFVKALALQDETGAISVLVTTDLHSYTRRMSDTVAEAVRQRYGVPRERLVLNASHTHSGPAITGEDVFRPSENIDADQQAVIRRYTAEVLDRITDLVGEAIGGLAPAELSFGQGAAGFGVNRRRIAAGMRHLPGPVDHDVPVLVVRGGGGSLRAVVFGYACHATSAPADYQIGGDWPGYAQAAVEQANPGAIAMFVTGCGADCDPVPRSMVEMPPVYGQIMGASVGQVLRRKLQPVSGPLTAAFAYVDIPFQTPPTRDELQRRLQTASGMHARHARQLLAQLDRDGQIADRYEYPIQVWRFGSAPTFIALGGEVVVDYALRLKRTYGWETTWVAGYSNDVMGYIASRRVLEEGGYEGGGAMVNYGRPGPLAPDVEDIIAHKVDELVARVAGGSSKETGR